MIVLADIFPLAGENFEYMKEIRRVLHRNPGVRFDNEFAISFIETELIRLGYTPVRCGRCGVVATIGKGDRCVLLRADTDGLSGEEKTGLPFSSKNGAYHGCGHDMHAAMLLGCAKILKECESELSVCVKLAFQSAEETLEGAKDMIEAGVLEKPDVDCAFMLHVMTGVPLPCGTVVVPSEEESTPCADFFELEFLGRSCHGSSPAQGIDPIYAGCSAVAALSEINSRELSAQDRAVLTVGSFSAGESANVIPDRAYLRGTLRCFGDELRERLKTRLFDICHGVAGAFRNEFVLRFTGSCPSLVNDGGLCRYAEEKLARVLPEGFLLSQEDFLREEKGSISGSEDFAYISRQVPSLMLAVCAGDSRCGYTFPLHHSMVAFDEKALVYGCGVYAGLVLGKNK